MSDLRPVDPLYQPRYPTQLSPEEIERLLRPGLLQRFAAETLAAGALLTGITLTGCASDAAPADPEGTATRKGLPQAGLSTRQNDAFRQRIDRLANELLGKHKDRAHWNARSSIRLVEQLQGNPPIKYPLIPISFGNSYVGIFDTEGARMATYRLFAQWGIELKPGMTVKGPGYEFVADGYDPTLGIGFKLIVPEGQVGFGNQKLPAQDDKEKLDDQELKALERDVTQGKLHVFVAKAQGFPNMDGDLYTPLEYYLASVVDYLNWVHGDRELDKDAVLGKKREAIKAPGQ